jgi:hypothetical protein
MNDILIKKIMKNQSILTIMFLLNSCVTTNAGITTSNIPLNHNLQNIKYITTDTIKKSWYNFDIGILGFPLQEPPIDEAIKELLSKHQGDALINIKYYTQKSIFLFITKNTLVIKADVVKIEKQENEISPTKKR